MKVEISPLTPQSVGQTRTWSLTNRSSLYGLLFVLLVAGLSVALTLQGWRSRVPAFDLLTYIHSGRTFLATGELPQHGDTGSYGSYKPAGTAWLMMPSMLLFADPRLSEYVGTALLHFFTLLGIFLLARNFFGAWCAYLAVLLYGLSHHGLFLAGSLWPNGRPDFYVWIVYFAVLWAQRRDARFLAAAATVWAVGMQVDMAILPALFILPAMWLYYRPPIRLQPLLLGVLLAFIVWLPYLRFELTRGFADIRSQLLLRNIFPGGDYQQTWCDPTLPLRRLEETASLASTRITFAAQAATAQQSTVAPVQFLITPGKVVWTKLSSNFVPVAPLPGLSTLLLLTLLASMVLLSVSRSPSGDVELFIPEQLWRPWLIPIAIIMVLAGFIFNEYTVARALKLDGPLSQPVVYKVLALQMALLLGGVLLLVEKPLARCVSRLWQRMADHSADPTLVENVRPLVLGLGVPWLILLVVAEPGKPERFWWLWPLQVIFLAAFATYLLPRLRSPRFVVWVYQLGLLFALLVNPFLLSRIDSWLRDGWAGVDAEQVQIVDYLAHHLRETGKEEGAIGYQTFLYPFMASYNITNPVYKVGAEFDLFFQYMYGITNSNRCAEGVSPDDEYRIVQLVPEPDPQAPRHYFDISMGDDFRLLQQFETYQVYQRKSLNEESR